MTHVRDANGNLKDDGTNLYDYDYRNQLVRIRRKSDMAVIGTYDYDGICRRTAKATSAGTTSFYWIGFELAMEYDAAGLVSRRHRGAGFTEVVSAQQRDIADLDQDGSTTDYVPLTPLYDGAYDCIGVLDHAGALAESYVHTYDGIVTIANAAGTPIGASAIGWQQGYGRMYHDRESGLLYAVHRYYSPTTGRFVSEDPMGRWFDSSSAGSGYASVGARYRNSWDPLGLGSDHTRDTPADRVAASVGALRRALESLSDEDHTEETRAILEEFQAGDVTIEIVDDKPDHGQMATTPIADKANRGNYKYLIKVWKGLFENAELSNKGVLAFGLGHELHHIGKHKCDKNTPWDKHHPEPEDRDKFNEEVTKLIKHLRKKSKKFADWYSGSDLWRGRQAVRLPGKSD